MLWQASGGEEKMVYRITKEKMDSYREHMLQEEFAPDTIKKYLRDIRAFAVWLECAADRQRKSGEIFTSKSQPGAEATASIESPVSDDGIHRSGVLLEEEAAVQVDKEASTGWKTHLTKAGYAPATINAMISSLNSFFDFLGWKECQVKFLKIQRRTFREQEKELSRAEYGRLLETARENGNSRLALLLETICATGIRVSEVRYITVEAFYRKRADISLKGKIRTILIPGKLCKKLRDYARKQNITTGEIFITRKGNSMSRCQIWRELKKLCEKAGVNPSKVFPHNLRHLFARTFYKVCRDIVKLADVLGHSSIETTRIYLMSTGETHARQMERLGLVS